MSDETETMRQNEYRELRATIRERGSLRLTLTCITFSVWAAAILIVCSWLKTPVFGLVPLIILAAGFEIAFALHVGVERVGRFIQVHHEPASRGGAVWEQTAMRFPGGGAPGHPLLPLLHIAAAVLNFTLTALLAGDPEFPEAFPSEPLIFVYAAIHALFIGRVLQAFRWTSGQRARDLETFSALLRQPPGDPIP